MSGRLSDRFKEIYSDEAQLKILQSIKEDNGKLDGILWGAYLAGYAISVKLQEELEEKRRAML